MTKWQSKAICNFRWSSLWNVQSKPYIVSKKITCRADWNSGCHKWGWCCRQGSRALAQSFHILLRSWTFQVKIFLEEKYEEGKKEDGEAKWEGKGGLQTCPWKHFGVKREYRKASYGKVETDKEKEREDSKPALEKTKLLRLLTTLPLYPLQMKSDRWSSSCPFWPNWAILLQIYALLVVQT